MYRMAGLAVFSQEVTILTISSATLQATEADGVHLS
jgi:hypothetical protein